LSSLVVRVARSSYCAGSLHNAIRCVCLAVVGGLLVAPWALPSPVRAQQAVTLAALQISLWPEFDKPSTLVILDGHLAPSVTLPADLSIRIPAAAGAPNAVASIAADGGLFQTAFTTSQAGGDIITKFTTSSASFRVEYYDPALVISGETRSFAFRWASDYAIGAVAVLVQQPVGARSLSAKPAVTSTGAGEYGLTYYTAALGALQAGGTVSLDLSYAKTGAGLSSDTVAGTTTSAAGPAGASNRLPLMLGGAALGLALIGVGTVWVVRNGRRARNPARGPRMVKQTAGPASRLERRRTEPRRARQSVSLAAAPPAINAAQVALETAPASFCPQCGQRHQAGDRFCRLCGAPVRE
jgi:hypothetical protein